MVDEVKETQNDGEKPQEETGEENNYILPDEAYKVLKWLALIALPALAVFVHVVGPAWNLPCVDQIVTTLNALAVLVGALIGVSQLTAAKPDGSSEISVAPVSGTTLNRD